MVTGLERRLDTTLSLHSKILYTGTWIITRSDLMCERKEQVKRNGARTVRCPKST